MKTLLNKKAILYGIKLLCCMLFFYGCKASGTAGDDGSAQNKTNTQKLYLKSLELVYKSDNSKTNLITQFDKKTTGYTINISGHETDKLVVSAAAEDAAAALDITVKGAAVPEIAVPKAGDDGFDILIRLSDAKGLSGEYTITIVPPKLTDENNNDLRNLAVVYAAGEMNLIKDFSSISKLYTIQVENGKTSAEVNAGAKSDKSTVELFYEDNKLGGAKSEYSAKIQLPSRDGTHTTLVVKITSALGQTREVTVIFNPYVTKQVTWSGAIQYNGNDDKTIENIVARDAKLSMQSVTLAQRDSKQTKWSFTVAETWIPVSFLVTLKNSAGEVFESAALYPSMKNTSNIALAIEAGDTGNRIANANELASKLGANINGNYSLANDIDLSAYVDDQGRPKVWAGPTGYKGTLYGNGYTIKGLLLKRTSSKVGLFGEVGEGAVIRDLVLEVSNDATSGAEINGVHFGGIVGNATGSMKVLNVTVRGSLSFAKAGGGGFVLLGGIIGESGLSAGKTIELENCISILNIELGTGSLSDEYTLGFGGLIGKAAGAGKHIIRNSYSTGNIKAKNNGNKRLIAGGLVGDAANTTLEIYNSYASGEVVVENSNNSWNADRGLYAGGLLGESKDNSTVIIKNSAALNPKVLAIGTHNAGIHYGRLIGGFHGAHSETLADNIALAGMVTGSTSGGTVDSSSGSLDGAAGLAVADDASGLRNKDAVWTGGGSYLKWDGSVWDFSGVSAGNRPVLKVQN
jgi:hypothetical protein